MTSTVVGKVAYRRVASLFFISGFPPRCLQSGKGRAMQKCINTPFLDRFPCFVQHVTCCYCCCCSSYILFNIASLMGPNSFRGSSRGYYNMYSYSKHYGMYSTWYRL